MATSKSKWISSHLVTSIIASIVTLGVTLGCGMVKDDKKKPGTDTPAPLSLTPFEQLTGEWVGIYRTLESGKASGEALSASLSFSENGDFALSLDSNSTARVEGQWNEFQGKTLILRITGSSIPRIGSSNQVAEPKYELLGSSLLISTDSYELKLGKKAAPATAQGPGGWHTTFVGSWVCVGEGQIKTTLLITDSADFKLSSVRKNERAFIAVGKLSPSDSSSLNLVPSASSDPLPEGAYFELRLNGASAELFLDRKDSSQAKLGHCQK